MHVSHPAGEAKFWLTPEVSLARSIGLRKAQEREAKRVVEAHLQEIENAWHKHFGG